MLNNEFLQDVSNRISGLLPMAAGVREDVEKNIERVLQSAFGRLNLVTREEFDAQQKVLQRAESAIAELEEQIKTLEVSQGLRPPGPPESEAQ